MNALFQARVLHTPCCVPWEFLNCLRLPPLCFWAVKVVQASSQLLRASPALWSVCHEPCSQLQNPFLSHYLKPMAQAHTHPSQGGLSWPRADARTLYSAWNWDVSSVKFCNDLLKGKGPRLRRCWGRMEGLYVFFFIWGWCAGCLSYREVQNLFI